MARDVEELRWLVAASRQPAAEHVDREILSVEVSQPERVDDRAGFVVQADRQRTKDREIVATDVERVLVESVPLTQTAPFAGVLSQEERSRRWIGRGAGARWRIGRSELMGSAA